MILRLVRSGSFCLSFPLTTTLFMITFVLVLLFLFTSFNSSLYHSSVSLLSLDIRFKIFDLGFEEATYF